MTIIHLVDCLSLIVSFVQWLCFIFVKFCKTAEQFVRSEKYLNRRFYVIPTAKSDQIDIINTSNKNIIHFSQIRIQRKRNKKYTNDSFTWPYREMITIVLRVFRWWVDSKEGVGNKKVIQGELPLVGKPTPTNRRIGKWIFFWRPGQRRQHNTYV